MSDAFPLISVILPLYNGQKYLAEAIESVLAQTYRNVELIVVDDGSTDNSTAIVQSFKPNVQYVYQSNQGTAVARNTGIAYAGGTLLAFLDQDDRWTVDKLSHQVEAFRLDPSLDMVFGQVRQFHSPDLNEELAHTLHCASELMPGCIPSALLVKRTAFLRVGLFDARWQIGEWIAWYVQAVELGLKGHMLPDLVTYRRLHATNQSVQARAASVEYARILKRSLDQRRKHASSKIGSILR